MTAIYIGAGSDVRPLIFLNDIDVYYYIDSQPYSEFGKLEYLNENGFNCYSRPNFVSSVDKEMLKVKYKLLLNEENLRVYNNKNKTVNYLINTSIPDDNDKILDLVINCQNLIVAGHDPDSSLIDRIENKLNFIGFDKTNFDVEETPENKNSVIHRLHTEVSFQQKFKKFTFVKNNDIFHFKNWNQFCKFVNGDTNETFI